MPQARNWTDGADTTIYRMRQDGSSWAEIGRMLGLSRNTVIERGRRLRAVAAAPVRKPVIEKQSIDDPNRGALPAGHELTWGLLTDAPYPEDERCGR